MITELLFEPRDLWVGVFWDRKSDEGFLVQHIYLGVPFFVFHISWPLCEYHGHPLPRPYRLWRVSRVTKLRRTYDVGDRDRSDDQGPSID
jgi:hypothetical protein